MPGTPTPTRGIGPSSATEEPLPGDPELEARVRDWMAGTGADSAHAAILCMLQDLEDRHPLTDALVQGAQRPRNAGR